MVSTAFLRFSTMLAIIATILLSPGAVFAQQPWPNPKTALANAGVPLAPSATGDGQIPDTEWSQDICG
jgi:hypothetical protein